MRLQQYIISIGGTSGLGAATAILAAQRGSKVVVAGRRSDKGNEIIKQIKANGGDAIFIRCDVSVENDVTNLVEQTVKHYGRLDWAFNNAGIFSGTHQHQPHNPAVFDEKQFEQDIAINIKGTHYCMKYELQQMVKQSEVESNPDDLKQKAKENPNDLHRSLPQYSIINNSSVAGITSTKLNYAYATTKHAIVGMSKSASQIYAKKGIRVNILCPVCIMSCYSEYNHTISYHIIVWMSRVE
jgi:NAD(P)-dependent dehydrogenase (short-subunit alcohol dehydrogenase family)